jgi:hypothetical protein
MVNGIQRVLKGETCLGLGLGVEEGVRVMAPEERIE